LRALAHGQRRRDGVSAALGGTGGGVQGFARSHAEALEARRIALLDRRGHGKLTWYTDVDLVSLLTGDLERARQFMHAELGTLAMDDDATARLRATLKAYLEEGRSVVATARRLSIHQSTVKYRIRKCQDLLGRPPGERSQKLEAAILLADSLKRSS
jgi:DNA-binding PucR family transcriptional regulator